MHKVRHVSEQAEPETIRDFVSYFAKGLELGDLPSARGTRYISSRIPLDFPDFNAKYKDLCAKKLPTSTGWMTRLLTEYGQC